MDTNIIATDEVVMNKIYHIRNQKVMIDKDLATLYGVSTGNLNKAVNRNIKRFPEDFMLQLNKEEFDNLIFQIGTSSWGGIRKLPNAFTEQGVAVGWSSSYSRFFSTLIPANAQLKLVVTTSLGQQDVTYKTITITDGSSKGSNEIE